MNAIKKYIPFTLRRYIKINLRYYRDLINGSHKKMATVYDIENNFHCIKSIEQPIKITQTAVFKTHNIGLAIAKLNNIIIGPGQIFSFWKLIGNPSQKNGYKKSRSIIGNSLQEEVGGGLCQLSGLVYFLALHAGLTITERHSHSLDIYKEEERFTPLGSDATVVYGYKDLRFLNSNDFPVLLSFTLTETVLTGKLLSARPTSPLAIEFIYHYDDTATGVTTICKTDEGSLILASNSYRLLHKRN